MGPAMKLNIESSHHGGRPDTSRSGVSQESAFYTQMVSKLGVSEAGDSLYGDGGNEKLFETTEMARRQIEDGTQQGLDESGS